MTTPASANLVPNPESNFSQLLHAATNTVFERSAQGQRNTRLHFTVDATSKQLADVELREGAMFDIDGNPLALEAAGLNDKQYDFRITTSSLLTGETETKAFRSKVWGPENGQFKGFLADTVSVDPLTIVNRFAELMRSTDDVTPMIELLMEGRYEDVQTERIISEGYDPLSTDFQPAFGKARSAVLNRTAQILIAAPDKFFDLQQQLFKGLADPARSERTAKLVPTLDEALGRQLHRQLSAETSDITPGHPVFGAVAAFLMPLEEAGLLKVSTAGRSLGVLSLPSLVTEPPLGELLYYRLSKRELDGAPQAANRSIHFAKEILQTLLQKYSQDKMRDRGNVQSIINRLFPDTMLRNDMFRSRLVELANYAIKDANKNRPETARMMPPLQPQESDITGKALYHVLSMTGDGDTIDQAAANRYHDRVYAEIIGMLYEPVLLNPQAAANRQRAVGRIVGRLIQRHGDMLDKS